eukprot:15366586-Ditylum_brightwellii.AAC.2
MEKLAQITSINFSQRRREVYALVDGSLFLIWLETKMLLEDIYVTKTTTTKYQKNIMVLVPLPHWADSIKSEWWLDQKYHPSMRDIMIDMALKSVMLKRKRAQIILHLLEEQIQEVATHQMTRSETLIVMEKQKIHKVLKKKVMERKRQQSPLRGRRKKVARLQQKQLSNAGVAA